MLQNCTSKMKEKVMKETLAQDTQYCWN
jgi:hypothetical protein